jgi:3-hydroxybutyryl-CoA dehydrogenase
MREKAMVRDPGGDDFVVGIVGAGAMGRGIAQVAVAGGMSALLYDAVDGAAAEAVGFVATMLERAVEKGRMEAEAATAARQRLEIVDDLEGLAKADVVIEAVVEDLAVKHQVFRRLEEIVADDVVLASNTSGLRIAAIAAACERRERIAGMHFFNPVPLMRLVEIVRAPETDAAAAESLAELGRRMGRVPVQVRDSPGFLVNLGGRAYTTEGLRIVTEGIATPSQVDAVMRDCCGFRMGPFELMDLTGIDVNFPASRSVYDGYFQDRRLATSPLHESLFLSGRLGRKTKAGFYDYGEDGKVRKPSADAESAAPPADRVALAEPDERLASLLNDAGAEILAADDGVAPLVCAPLGEDCTATAARLGLDHRRLIGIDLSADSSKRVTMMTAPGVDAAVRDAVIARLARGGAAVTAIHDSPGFIAQRIRAMVANLGCEMAQIGLAAPADIDTAMTLGLNYPQGPLQLADAMGPATVLAILGRLQEITGDDRYRPSQWLRRRALLGLSTAEPD